VRRSIGYKRHSDFFVLQVDAAEKKDNKEANGVERVAEVKSAQEQEYDDPKGSKKREPDAVGKEKDKGEDSRSYKQEKHNKRPPC
jgi:hypothetical protein